MGGFIALGSILAPHIFLGDGEPRGNLEVRVVTTSVKDDHLRVLWGEIGRYIGTCRIPLLIEDGGPLYVTHKDIRKRSSRKDPVTGLCPMDSISYLRGMVSEKGEGMAGHHAYYTLGIIDEASGVDEHVYTQMGTWAKRILIIGNCNDCPPTHFWRKGCRGGDILAAS